MLLNGTPVQNGALPETPLPTAGDESQPDGGFVIEGDGGTVDSGNQASVPPPPPPAC